MRRTTKALTVAGVAGALAVTAGGLTAAANAAASTTITVTAVQTGSKLLVDKPPKKQLNPGDKFEITEKLLQSGKKIGADRIVLTDEAGNKALADGVFTFHAGTLHAHGMIPFPPPNGKAFHVPIVGGTGAYQGAKGTVTVTQKSQNSSIEVFQFTP